GCAYPADNLWTRASGSGAVCELSRIRSRDGPRSRAALVDGAPVLISGRETEIAGATAALVQDYGESAHSVARLVDRSPIHPLSTEPPCSWNDSRPPRLTRGNGQGAPPSR